MKRLSTLIIQLILCALSYPALAQYDWFLNITGSGYVGAESLSIDPSNNVVVIGNFENGAQVGGSSYTGKGSFLLKLTRKGTPIWHKIIRYGNSDFRSLSHVGTDGTGNIYIAGTFPETATIDGTAISGDMYNCFIAKLNSAGQLQWVKVIRNLQEIFDMKVNATGNVLLFSRHLSTLTIDNTNLNVGSNSFGVLLNTSGNLMWAKTLGNPQQYNTWSKACALDNASNAYFHGIFSGTLTVDGKQVVSGGGNYDFFVAKTNSSGVCQWITSAVRKLPSQYETNNPPNGLIIERGALDVDEEGNVYMGGAHWGEIKLGQITLTGDHTFLAKYNANGEVQWAKSNSKTSASGTVDDIVTRNGQVYVAGIIPSQFYFSIYNTTGTALNEAELIPLSGDIASGLGVDAQDSIYMSGRQYTQTNLQGFVFKYKYSSSPMPGNALTISGETSFCVSENSLTFTTAAITNAQSYEWVIVHQMNTYTHTTTEPLLELNLPGLTLTSDFSIKVRGVNPTGAGGYSALFIVTKEEPLSEPTLLSSCEKIYLETEESDGSIEWYYNNALANQYDENENSIKPEQTGDFYVTVSNACGIRSSNTVTFTRLNQESIFIPNLITPNADAFNDRFIVDEKLTEPQLTISNRWGETIFATKNYRNNWDGANHPSGVYFFQVLSNCLSVPIQGSITVLR